MPHCKAKWNEYVSTMVEQSARYDVIDKIPKMVALAVAISALTTGGDQMNLAYERFVTEWWILYDNGIIPQKPPFPRNDTVSL